MMKKIFVKDGRTFSCIATEENVKHLALNGWVPAKEPEPVLVAPSFEDATIEAPAAPRRGRPRKEE